MMPGVLDMKRNMQAGDIAADRFTHILKEEFQGLHDRVYFLQPWDMTVAAHNKLYHPPDFVNQALADIFINWMCS